MTILLNEDNLVMRLWSLDRSGEHKLGQISNKHIEAMFLLFPFGRSYGLEFMHVVLV